MSPRMNRVFSMFTVMFGAQKMSSVYEGMNHDAVADIWDGQLRGFDDQTVNRAMQSVMDDSSDWPPSLPAFKSICRQFVRAEPVPTALPAPRDPVPPEVAEALQSKPLEDHLRWVRNPKSFVALRMLRQAAERDRRLHDILLDLIDHPMRVTNPDVQKALSGMRGLIAA